MFPKMCQEGEWIQILSVDQLKQSSPSSMVDGTVNYKKADFNLLFLTTL